MILRMDRRENRNDRRSEPDRVEAAWLALDDDDPEKALGILRRAAADDPARFVAECAAHLALDDLAAARDALDRADALDLPFDDLAGLWTRAELLLRSWRIAEAEAVYETIEKLDRTPDVLDALAFCAELRHDGARADRFYREAERLDPDGCKLPPRLGEREFWAEIDAAVADLPQAFQRVLDECRVEVLAVPTIELARRGNLAELSPETLGLFSGPSLLDSGYDAPPELPPVIYLFQRNLERATREESTLIDEIRITLYHELGHFLGFDEEGVDRMGLG
jgi:predicted Zn-dependent protease with MMP-like domain